MVLESQFPHKTVNPLFLRSDSKQVNNKLTILWGGSASFLINTFCDIRTDAARFISKGRRWLEQWSLAGQGVSYMDRVAVGRIFGRIGCQLEWIGLQLIG